MKVVAVRVHVERLAGHHIRRGLVEKDDGATFAHDRVAFYRLWRELELERAFPVLLVPEMRRPPFGPTSLSSTMLRMASTPCSVRSSMNHMFSKRTTGGCRLPLCLLLRLDARRCAPGLCHSPPYAI